MIFRHKNISLLFLCLLVSQLYNIESSGQTNCVLPVIENRNPSSPFSIAHVEIKNPNSVFDQSIFLSSPIFGRTAVSSVLTGISLYNNAKYTVEVKLFNPDPNSQVYIYVDANGNGSYTDAKIDYFTNLVFNSKTLLYTTVLSLPSASPRMNIVAFSSGYDKLDNSALCSGKFFNNGEIEGYGFQVLGCPSNITNFSAGANDIICSGSLASLSGITPNFDKDNNLWTSSDPTFKTTSSLNASAFPKTSSTYTLNTKLATNGCEYSTSKIVWVDLLPNVKALTSDKTEICDGQDATLTLDTKIGGDITVEWWKDGDLKPLAVNSNMSLLVNQPGIYFAKLYYTVLSNCVTATYKTPVLEIKPSPVPVIEVISKNNCLSQTAMEIRATGSLYNINWYYFNGRSYVLVKEGIEQSVYKPTIPGLYRATANVLGFNCVGTSKDFSVLPEPSIPTVNKTKSLICPGSRDTLRADVIQSPVPAKTYEWIDHDKNQPISPTQQIIVSQAGNYKARATASNGCVSGFSEIVNVSIIPPLKSFINLSGEVALCNNQAVTLNVNTNLVGRTGIQWYLGSLRNNPVSTQSISYTTSSTYQGKVYARAFSNNGSCPQVDSVNITVLNASPTISVKGNLCLGSTATLNLSISNGVEYTWLKDKTRLNQNTNSIPINSSGFYEVIVTIDTISLCQKTASINVNFVAPPRKPTIDAVGPFPLTLCSDEESKNLTAKLNPLDRITDFKFNWFKDRSPLANTASIQTSGVGLYAVNVTDNKTGCTSIDSSLSIGLSYLEIPQIQTTNTCLSLNTSLYISRSQLLNYIQNMVSFTWTRNDTIVLTSTQIPRDSISYKPTKSGVYKFSYVNRNGCVSQVSNPIFINPLPLADAGNDINICFGNSITVSPKQIIANNNYFWQSDVVTAQVNLPTSFNFNSNTVLKPPATRKFYLFAEDKVSKCRAVDSLLINVFANPLNFEVNSKDPSCGGGLGTLKAFVGGAANLNLSYVWYSIQGNKVDSIVTKIDSIQLKPGLYNAKVVASNGCEAEQFEIIISNPSSTTDLQIIPLTVKNPSCTGRNDGAVSVKVANNVGATLRYSWKTVNGNLGNQNINGSSLSNLIAGAYEVTVQDEQGCASIPIVLTDTLKLSGGKIRYLAGNLTIGNSADTIRNIVSPSGSLTKINIFWQKQEPALQQNWTDLRTDTNLTLFPGKLTRRTLFRRVAQNVCGISYSDTVSINVVQAVVRDSVVLSGGGELGIGQISLRFFGDGPWKVILMRRLNNVVTYDTLPLLQQNQLSASRIYSFVPQNLGTYTIYQLNNLEGRGSGTATIVPRNNNVISIYMTGGGLLGSPINLRVTGQAKYPAEYSYFYYVSRNDLKPSDTITIELKDSIFSFIPSKIGYYKGYTMLDASKKAGVVFGEAEIIAPIVKPTANIAGGGVIGSKITITVDDKGIPAPWEILMEIESDSGGNKILSSEYLFVEKSPYTFPSRKPGVYRIKAVNGNREGNGEAIVIVTDKDSAEVFVWNALSPNGDGKNDKFIIEIPKRLSEKSAAIVIFDREGTILVNLDIKIGSNLSLNDVGDMFIFEWDGKNKNKEDLNPGTYFFSFKVQGFENDKKASKSGFIELRR